MTPSVLSELKDGGRTKESVSVERGLERYALANSCHQYLQQFIFLAQNVERSSPAHGTDLSVNTIFPVVLFMNVQCGLGTD